MMIMKSFAEKPSYLKELNLSDFYEEINRFDKIRSYASRAIIIANKDAYRGYLLPNKKYLNNMILIEIL